MSGEPAADGLTVVDLAAVHTLPDLANAFNRLRDTRSYADLDRAVNPRGVQPRVLPASTLSNLLNGKSVPTRDTVVTFLAACGLDEPAQAPWLAAWERVSTGHLHRPAGAVRVREARPRLLGVHACIQVNPAATDLPEYVPRDLDADLRTAITAAAERGGFVLLVGGSSVGKTRALFEAVRAVLPEWWLVHPDPADTDAVRALAATPTPRTVAWLDELQNYLTAPGGLPAGLARGLVAAGTVLVATLWPDEYAARAAPRTPDQPDSHANDRELLGLAHVIDVPDTFSNAERRRAETLAADRRIRTALDTPDHGFTQVLAAGPELVRRWEQATDPYGKAVITAALDARRVEARDPLTRDLLAAAAPGYLTPTQVATAPPHWLDQALAYATTELRGAAATLTPVGTTIGEITGYTVADYLYQHSRRIRRCTPLPDAAWQALADHGRPDDAYRLGNSAERRMRYQHAEAIYRRGADNGESRAAERLAKLLVEQGRIGELRERADAGDQLAAEGLCELLAKQGHEGELRRRADTSYGWAACLLADLLAEQGRTDEAITILRAAADTADMVVTDLLVERLTGLLVEQGRSDEAIAFLRPRADDADEYCTARLADLLAEQGRTDEAVTILRQYDAIGRGYPTGVLVRLLGEQGHAGELRERAGAGDRAAAQELAELLAEQGHTDELRERADAGDHSASQELAKVLGEQGHADELRERADAGDHSASQELAKVLGEQGRIDEAIMILRPWADAGDHAAAHRLTDLLADQGRTEELQAEVHAGTPGAADRLAALSRQQGQITTEGRGRDQPE